MTILTILLFISCILFFIGYRKERSRRIALESEVKSFADRKDYDINQLLEKAESKIKPKAMTAPIVNKPRIAETISTDKKILSEVANAPTPPLFSSTTIIYDKTKTKIPRGYKRNNGLKKWPLKPTDIIDILFRDGKIWKEETVRGWDWKHQYGGSDIIAYKVVKPKTMKRKNK